jgi:peptide/nickel transport system substrate-binding protein
MRIEKSKRWIIVAALALSGLMGAWAQGGAKTVFIGQVNPPVTFNPLNAGDVASQYDQQPIFDSLLDMVEPLKFLPKLADSFELKGDRTLVIKLNPKASWTDGEPVTAEDVAFTIELVANPNTEVTVGTYIAPFAGLSPTGKLPEGQTQLSSLKVVDKKTLEITLEKRVDLNMIKEQFGVKLLILPKHVLKNVDPAKLSQAPFFQNPSVTSGPFKFVRYAKDQYVEYAANPDYYRGAPKIQKLFIKIVPATNLAAQLRTGEIHFNSGVGIGLIPNSDAEDLKGAEGLRWKLERKTGIQFAIFNVATIPDVRVRQAIAYAIDRQTIISKLLKGNAESVDGPFTTLNPYFNAKLKPYAFDPAKARKLLADAGWKGDRVLRFVVPIGNKDREQSAAIIAQNLLDVGIKTEISKFDFPTIMQLGKKHDFDILLIGNNLLLEPDNTATLYASTGSVNFSGYSNPAVDDLFEKGRAEPTFEKRKAIYDKLQEIWSNDLPQLTLYSDVEFLVVSKKLAVGEPRFFGTFYDVNLWDLR